MKKIIIIFVLLVAAFIGVWTFKLKTPLTPSDPYTNGLSSNRPWWEILPEGEVPSPDDAWVLDPEIPENYVPVLGSEELYMVIDENGKIQKYRHRIRQEDGSWLWEDVDPNIPQGYMAVEGLENVYRVEQPDGSYQYFKYTRNEDDTFFFTEVDENGAPLQNDTPRNGEIPPNYIHVSGNIYAVYNEHGVLLGYKERVVREDGSYGWIDCDAPPDEGQQSGGDAGGIPGLGVAGNDGNSGNGDIYIITGDDGKTKTGYVETNTFTETKQEDGWTVVYETTVTKTYDISGNLISTKKDGPTEINRFPTTSVNTDILPSN